MVCSCGVLTWPISSLLQFHFRKLLSAFRNSTNYQHPVFISDRHTGYYFILCIAFAFSIVHKSRHCLGYQEYSFSRLFVPWNIRSHDGTFVLRTFCSLEHSFPRPFIPWNFRSQDRSFPGTYSLLGPFVPGTVRSLEHSLPG